MAHHSTSLTRPVLLLVVTGLFAVQLGCGPAVDQATRTSIDSSLDELTEDQNKDRLNELMGIEGVESAGHRFGAGLTSGMFSTAAGLDPQLDEMELQRRVETAFQLVAEQFRRELGPVIEEIAASTTREVLEVVGSPDNRRRAARMAAVVTDAVMEAIAEGMRGRLGPAVHQMLVDHVGPGIEQLLVDHVGPGIQEMLDDEFNQALGETARVVSRQAAIGTTEGLVEMEILEPDEPTLTELLVERFLDLTDALGWVTWVLLLVFVALFVVFVGWATRLLFQARDVKKKGDVRGATAEQLAEAIQQVEPDDPESEELLHELGRQLRDLEDD